MPGRIRSVLSEEIQRGVYGASGRLPAERSLAERFGVWRTSVRESLNFLVKDGVLVRLVGKGTFVSSAAGRVAGAARGAGREAGFPDRRKYLQFVQPGYTRVWWAPNKPPARRIFNCCFGLSGKKRTIRNSELRAQTREAIQGVLVAGGLRKKTLERLLEWQVPVVLTDLIVENDLASAVGADYGSGTRQALEHLASLGHRRIGFIGFPTRQNTRPTGKRWTGWTCLTSPSGFISSELPDLAALASWRAIMRCKHCYLRPDRGLPLSWPPMIWWRWAPSEALNLAGIPVPGQISVIGYDDLDGSAKSRADNDSILPGRGRAHGGLGAHGSTGGETHAKVRCGSYRAGGARHRRPRFATGGEALITNWDRSRQMLERSRQALAGGVSSPFRAKAPVPLYFEDGRGVRLRDVDGTKYIDYRLAGAR